MDMQFLKCSSREYDYRVRVCRVHSESVLARPLRFHTLYHVPALLYTGTIFEYHFKKTLCCDIRTVSQAAPILLSLRCFYTLFCVHLCPFS